MNGQAPIGRDEMKNNADSYWSQEGEKSAESVYGSVIGISNTALGKLFGYIPRILRILNLLPDPVESIVYGSWSSF
jgi:hypothetical protein